MTVGISYDDDSQKAIETIQAALTKIPEIVAEPAPQIGIQEFADSSVNACRVHDVIATLCATNHHHIR